MRKSVAIFATMAMTAVSLVPVVPALANSNNGAAVVRRDTCSFGIQTPDGFVSAHGPVHYVVNKAGETTAICNMNQTNGTVLSRAYVERDWGCYGGSLGTSFDTKAILTPGEQVTIMCKFHQ